MRAYVPESGGWRVGQALESEPVRLNPATVIARETTPAHWARFGELMMSAPADSPDERLTLILSHGTVVGSFLGIIEAAGLSQDETERWTLPLEVAATSEHHYQPPARRKVLPPGDGKE